MAKLQLQFKDFASPRGSSREYEGRRTGRCELRYGAAEKTSPSWNLKMGRSIDLSNQMLNVRPCPACLNDLKSPPTLPPKMGWCSRPPRKAKDGKKEGSTVVLQYEMNSQAHHQCHSLLLSCTNPGSGTPRNHVVGSVFSNNAEGAAPLTLIVSEK